MKGLLSVIDRGDRWWCRRVLCVAPAHAQREEDRCDRARRRPGDCEITDLEYGLLRLSTDDMGTISIEWSAITWIDSEYTFDVQVAGGRR